MSGLELFSTGVFLSANTPDVVEMKFIQIFMWFGGILLCVAVCTSYLGMMLSMKKSQKATQAAMGAKNVAKKWRETPPKQQAPGSDAESAAGSGGAMPTGSGTGSDGTDQTEPSDANTGYDDRETVTNDTAPEPDTPDDAGTPDEDDVTTSTQSDTEHQQPDFSQYTGTQPAGYTGTESRPNPPDSTGSDASSSTDSTSTDSTDSSSTDSSTTSTSSSTSSSTTSSTDTSSSSSSSTGSQDGTGDLVQGRNDNGSVNRVNEERAEEIAANYVHDVRNGDPPDLDDYKGVQGISESQDSVSDINEGHARAAAHEYTSDTELPDSLGGNAGQAEKAVQEKVNELTPDSNTVGRGGFNEDYENQTSDGEFEVADYVDEAHHSDEIEDFTEASSGTELARSLYNNPDEYDADDGWGDSTPELNEDKVEELADEVQTSDMSEAREVKREARRKLNNAGDDIMDHDVTDPASQAVADKASESPGITSNNSTSGNYEFGSSSTSASSTDSTSSASGSAESGSETSSSEASSSVDPDEVRSAASASAADYDGVAERHVDRDDMSSAYQANIASALENSTEAFTEAAENPDEFADQIDNDDVDSEELIDSVGDVSQQAGATVQRGFQSKQMMDSLASTANCDPSSLDSVDDFKEEFGSTVEGDADELADMANMSREERESAVVDQGREMSGNSTESTTKAQQEYGRSIADTITDGDASETLDDMSEEEHTAVMYQTKKTLDSMQQTHDDPRFNDGDDAHNNQTTF